MIKILEFEILPAVCGRPNITSVYCAKVLLVVRLKRVRDDLSFRDGRGVSGGAAALLPFPDIRCQMMSEDSECGK